MLSFVFLGIYWNNHHHMLHAAHRINGLILYLASIPLAYVDRWLSVGLFVLVAAMWLVPDRRMEKQVVAR